jgi:C-terminal processing protease CtpA/Prc
VVSRLIEQPVASPQFHIPQRSGFQRRGWLLCGYEIEPYPELHYGGPAAALIDARAISWAEDFCICLGNSGRVTFVGSLTAGTDGNVTFIRLPRGGGFRFTGMRVLHGDGRRFQNIGIIPDVPAEPTVVGIAAGRDEALEAAIAALDGQQIAALHTSG